MIKERQFVYYWLCSITLFVALFFISIHFDLYKMLPAYGFIGYGLVILNILWTLNLSRKPWHFIASSVLLIVFGTIGTLDIILSKQEMLETLLAMNNSWLKKANLNAQTLDDYVNVLIILLNVFTSAIAGNALFYGLNHHNFQDKQ